MHLLIFRFSALGDIALTVPVLSALSEQYPQHHFTIVSRPFVAPLFAHLGDNVTFRGVDLKQYAGIGGLYRLAKELQAETKSDAVADLHDVLRTKVLRIVLRLHGLRIATLDKGRRAKQLLVKKKVRHTLPHATARYAAVFSQLGLPVELCYTPPRLIPLWEKSEEERWIGIAPFAAHEGKVYPLSLLHAVAWSLLKRYEQAHLFVFGTRAEMVRLRTDWTHPRLTFVAEEVSSLSEELRLMQQLDVMVSMDSANLHLASLVGTPAVSVWGATHPDAGFTGYGQSLDDVVQLDMPCRPCSIFGNKPCQYGDYRCLLQILPEHLLTKVEKYL